VLAIPASVPAPSSTAIAIRLTTRPKHRPGHVTV
jgi:hypothetical protein